MTSTLLLELAARRPAPVRRLRPGEPTADRASSGSAGARAARATPAGRSLAGRRCCSSAWTGGGCTSPTRSLDVGQPVLPGLNSYAQDRHRRGRHDAARPEVLRRLPRPARRPRTGARGAAPGRRQLHLGGVRVILGHHGGELPLLQAALARPPRPCRSCFFHSERSSPGSAASSVVAAGSTTDASNTTTTRRREMRARTDNLAHFAFPAWRWLRRSPPLPAHDPRRWTRHPRRPGTPARREARRERSRSASSTSAPLRKPDRPGFHRRDRRGSASLRLRQDRQPRRHAERRRRAAPLRLLGSIRKRLLVPGPLLLADARLRHQGRRQATGVSERSTTSWPRTAATSSRTASWRYPRAARS